MTTTHLFGASLASSLMENLVGARAADNALQMHSASLPAYGRVRLPG